MTTDVLSSRIRKSSIIGCGLLSVMGCSHLSPEVEAATETPSAEHVQQSLSGAHPRRDECRRPSAKWIFCSDFEEPLSPWIQRYDADNRIPDPGPSGDAGNHVAVMRVGSGQSGAGIVARLKPDRQYYLRFYVKWQKGFDMTLAHHGPGGLMADAASHMGRSGSRPGGDDFMTASLEADVRAPFAVYSYTYYRGMYQDCPPIEISDPKADRCFGDSLPCVYPGDNSTTYCTKPEHRPHGNSSVVPGRWYCLEQKVDMGRAVDSADEADGQLDIWLDTREVGHFDHLWLRTSTELLISKLWLYLFLHNGHQSQGLMFDNVVVSSARVGCNATAS